MSRPTWRGRPTQRALRYTLTLHGRTCWLCHHTINPGAESLDHVLPAHDHPELEWEPTNWRPAHLHPAGNESGKGCHITGCTCPGNTGRRNKPWTSPPSRSW